MWLTILSTLLGIVSSTIPGIIRYFEKRQELQYELAIGRLKLEAATRGYQIAIDVAGTQADVSEIQSARQHDTITRASQWVVNLRSSVRPVITYTFFALILLVKFGFALGMVIYANEGTLTAATLDALYSRLIDDPTNAIFSVIVGFYFGGRAMEKYSKNDKTG